MFTKRSKIRAGMVCLVAAGALCYAAGTLFAADDQPKPIPARETASPPSENITKSITINTPLVTVRSNPAKPGNAAAGVQASQAGQYAFVDSQGRLTAPQPGSVVTGVPAGAPARSAPFANPTDPNATFADTRHIRAAISARIDEKGQIKTVCVTHSDSPDHKCDADVHQTATEESAKENQ